MPMPRRLLLLLATAAALLTLHPVSAQDAAPPPAAQAPVSIDAAFQAFWAASSPTQAERRAEDVAKTGITFDDAYERLKRGRTYTAQKTGVVLLTNHAPKTDYHYHVNIPDNYDPTRRYQVRF